MAGFTNFTDLLPDPNYKIGTAGDLTAKPSNDSSVTISGNTGSAGPGFTKVKFNSNNQIQVSRTISGRGVTASPGYHMWEFSISYNQITRAEFDPVASFLEQRRGRLYPFYVVLPQHAAPQDSTFLTHVGTNGNVIKTGWIYTTTATTGTSPNGIALGTATISFTPQTVAPFKIGDSITVSGVTPTIYNGTFTVTGATTSSVSFASLATSAQTQTGAGKIVLNTPAGSPFLLISSYTSGGATSNFSGTPTPGDFFTITDTNDALHKKAYKVVRVESNANYLSSLNRPGLTQMRIYTVPPLTRTTSADSTVNFLNPKFRVIQKSDVIEYELDTDNLYQFSLNLEEILP